MINVFQSFKIIRISIFLLIFTGFQIVNACPIHPNEDDCDLCGCSTSSGSSGFGTLGNASFLGVRYIYQDFESRNGIFSNSPTSNEQFNTYQIWGRFPINESFSLNAIVPYQNLKRTFENSTEQRNGLGDVTLIGWYKLPLFKKNSDDETKEMSNHQLHLGLGVKLPTGAFEESLTNRVNPGFQVGTGSIDAIFSVMHTYSNNQLGLNSSVTYYLKTENKNEYQFGNQFSFASSMFYNFPFETSSLRPFVGISTDVYNAIKQFNETLPDTNGAILNGTLGSEFSFNKIILGANFTLPMSQNLFGNNVNSKNRLTIYLNYVL